MRKDVLVGYSDRLDLSFLVSWVMDGEEPKETEVLGVVRGNYEGKDVTDTKGSLVYTYEDGEVEREEILGEYIPKLQTTFIVKEGYKGDELVKVEVVSSYGGEASEQETKYFAENGTLRFKW